MGLFSQRTEYPVTSRRELILETAVRLFRERGYHATGIDKIIAESGVAKMTLYRYFKSKDELILAALRRWDEQSRHWLVTEIAARSKSVEERPLVLFDVLDDWFDSNDFKGCMFINAAAEYSDHDDPIHTAAAEHKRLFRRYLREQVVAGGYENADELTDQIVFLMEGAIVTAQVSRQRGAGAQARKAAETLLSNHARGRSGEKSFG